MRRHEITDQQWAAIAPLLSGKVTDCGVTAKDNRLFFNAIVWIMRTGCPWADVPVRFDKSNTASKRSCRLAPRYEKPIVSFLAFWHVGASLDWLRQIVHSLLSNALAGRAYAVLTHG